MSFAGAKRTGSGAGSYVHFRVLSGRRCGHFVRPGFDPRRTYSVPSELGTSAARRAIVAITDISGRNPSTLNRWRGLGCDALHALRQSAFSGDLQGGADAAPFGRAVLIPL